MAGIKVGVLTEADVNGPMDVGSSDKLWDGGPGNWALIWFIIAVVILFIL